MEIIYAKISLISLIILRLYIYIQKFFLSLLESYENFYKLYKWVLRELLSTLCQRVLKRFYYLSLTLKHLLCKLYQIVLAHCVLNWLWHYVNLSSQVKSIYHGDQRMFTASPIYKHPTLHLHQWVAPIKKLSSSLTLICQVFDVQWLKYLK